ncbi:hypothetical protein GGI01_003105, partial [Coemansia sp. RSA 376]
NIMLLALVCPKFCRVEMDLRDITAYNASVSKALEDVKFSKYASQLNRLIISA